MCKFDKVSEELSIGEEQAASIFNEMSKGVQEIQFFCDFSSWLIVRKDFEVDRKKFVEGFKEADFDFFGYNFYKIESCKG